MRITIAGLDGVSLKLIGNVGDNNRAILSKNYKMYLWP